MDYSNQNNINRLKVIRGGKRWREEEEITMWECVRQENLMVSWQGGRQRVDNMVVTDGY